MVFILLGRYIHIKEKSRRIDHSVYGFGKSQTRFTGQMPGASIKLWINRHVGAFWRLNYLNPKSTWIIFLWVISMEDLNVTVQSRARMSRACFGSDAQLRTRSTERPLRRTTPTPTPECPPRATASARALGPGRRSPTRLATPPTPMPNDHGATSTVGKQNCMGKDLRGLQSLHKHFYQS